MAISDIDPMSKDTSHSCIFQWPDRPPDTLPPHLPPPPTPPECYPYCEVDDWPHPPVPPPPSDWPPPEVPPGTPTVDIDTFSMEIDFNNSNFVTPYNGIEQSSVTFEIGPALAPAFSYDSLLFLPPPHPSPDPFYEVFTTWLAGYAHEVAFQAHSLPSAVGAARATTFPVDMDTASILTGYFRLKINNFAPHTYPIGGEHAPWSLTVGMGNDKFISDIHFLLGGVTPAYYEIFYGKFTWDLGLHQGTITGVKKRNPDNDISSIW